MKINYVNLLSAAGYVDELYAELEIRQAQELVKKMPITRDEDSNDDNKSDEFKHATRLMNLYFNSVVNWSDDKLFNDQETTIIRGHFNELLLRYKMLIEAYLNANINWKSLKDEYYETFQNSSTKQGIKQMYLKMELDNQLQDVTDWIDNFPAWVSNNHED